MGWFSGFLSAGKSAEQDPEYSGSILKVEEILKGIPETEARFLACTALLLARIANSDEHVSDGEKRRITGLLRAQMKLPEDQALAVTAIVADNVAAHSIEHHLVIRRLNEITDRTQRASIIRMMFHVACEDDVSEAESEEIGRVAASLMLSRPEFISLRSEFKQHLSLLKNLPK